MRFRAIESHLLGAMLQSQAATTLLVDTFFPHRNPLNPCEMSHEDQATCSFSRRWKTQPSVNQRLNPTKPRPEPTKTYKNQSI